MKDKIRSEGVKKLFAFFEEHYGDKHYISLKGEIAELKRLSMTVSAVLQWQ